MTSRSRPVTARDRDGSDGCRQAPGLRAGEEKRFERIAEELDLVSRSRSSNRLSHRRYYELLRESLHLFEDVVGRFNEKGEDLIGYGADQVKALAGRAILELGGEAEPAQVSLRDYDHMMHGPFLGVSDEGSAVDVIRRAALTSPKARVLGRAPPIVVGLAHDAERLAAAGEMAIGPEEYRDIRLGSLGSILTSTNVGTRLNLRYYKLRPTIQVLRGPTEQAAADAIAQARALLEPFVLTPDRRPRATTVLAFFEPRTPYQKRRRVLSALNAALEEGDFSDPERHRVGLLAAVGWGAKGLKTAFRNIDLASDLGIAEAAISGVVRLEAADKISMPSLLQYFSPDDTARLLKYASERNVSVGPKNQVDPVTVARSVWAGLQVARNMGLELGKYGLFPLTIDESGYVMGLLQAWFSDWTAAPAFYVDFPTVASGSVYTEANIAAGLREWLRLVAQHNIQIVLVDTADKDRGRRLLKNRRSDGVGILTREEVRNLDGLAASLGVRVLWAGGITLAQVLEFGMLEVFGIYVTSSAAALVPVSSTYASDPLVTAVKEPTLEGVSATKLVLEAGFLIARLEVYGQRDAAESLEDAARNFVRVANVGSPSAEHQERKKALVPLVEDGWRVHYAQANADSR